MEISLEAEVCSLCQELVRCPSLPGQEQGVSEIVEREMRTLGYDEVQRDEVGNVVGLVRGAQSGPCVLFDAHMDVVPATSPEMWRYSPYSAQLSEGRIWGRGATDDKGPLAAAIVAFGSIPRDKFRGTLVLSASVGEEMIEGLALEHVLRRHLADVVVICEPTGLKLGVGHKGRAGLVVTAEGVAAHSSRPELGVNAVYLMMQAIKRIRALPLPQDELLGRGVCELVEIISSPYPGTSMVPGLCTARFDRRLVRGETAENVLAGIRTALAGIRGLMANYHRPTLACYTGLAFTLDDFHAAWHMSEDHDVVRRARRGLAEAKQSSELYLAPFCTNGSLSAGELGLPTLIYGPGDVDNAHAMDESLRIEELMAALWGYRALAQSLTMP